MKYTTSLFILLWLIGNGCATGQTPIREPFARYGVYDTDGIKPQEYRQRRAAVLRSMDSGSVAIFRSSDLSTRNGDTEYKFRQNDNFLYLTGCTESNSTLILSKDGIHVDSAAAAVEVLFTNIHKKDWSGYNVGLEGARDLLGFGAEDARSAAVPAEQLRELLPRILASKKILYYTSSLPDIIFEPVSNMKIVAPRDVKKWIADKYPNLVVKASGSLVNDLRSVKSSAELGLMRKAIQATVRGYIEAAKQCRPGMYEYELQAIIEYNFTRNGCEYPGFPTIIGSGPNSLSFHYDANRRQMNNGELVVMDIGAEYHGYSADVTRTIPVNGIFSPEQKELYDLVLNVQRAAIAEVKPYIPMSAAAKKAMNVLADGLLKLGIIRDRNDAAVYCPHGISHFVGLDVHDVGSSNSLLPGMVFTVEPGVYIPEGSPCDQKYWGIGMRIEDDVLVTESGCTVLSGEAPKTREDIEDLMNYGKSERGK
jgi:Xaa-Pro aminopeptidase